MLETERIQRVAIRSEACSGEFEHPGTPDYSHVPGMISKAEANYLHWLIAFGYTGSGKIVEVGTWLGKSTLYLADGLIQSGCGGKLYSFDRFIWDGQIDNLKSGLNLGKGANFQPYFEENIAPVRHVVDVTNVNFHELVWSGGAVEILFLDAPKNIHGFRSCMKAFVEELIPGQSLVVFQDYLHPPSYELALCIGELGDAMSIRHVVESSGTVSFLVQRGIAVAEVELPNFKPHKMTVSEIEKAWERILSPLPPEASNRFTAAKVFHFFKVGMIAEACDAMRSFEFKGKAREQWSYWAKQKSFQEQYQPLIPIIRELIQESQ